MREDKNLTGEGGLLCQAQGKDGGGAGRGGREGVRVAWHNETRTTDCTPKKEERVSRAAGRARRAQH